MAAISIDHGKVQVFDDAVPTELYTQLLHAVPKLTWQWGWRSKLAHARYWHHEISRGAKGNVEDTTDNVHRHGIAAFSAYIEWLRQEVVPADTRLLRFYLNAHTFGTDGSPHTDSEHADEVTLVLFMNQQWRAEFGGETVVFDENGDIAHAVFPKSNRMMVFPSNSVHGPQPLSKLFLGLRVVLVAKLGAGSSVILLAPVAVGRQIREPRPTTGSGKRGVVAVSLKVAVQMDPLESINIAGDSSFALMLSAQARGHSLFHYDVGSLTLDADDRLWALARPVEVRGVAGDHFAAGEPERIDLGRDIDLVLMRQDPPFDMGYITATHLLERIQGETLVVNDPASVRNAPEKVMVLDFRRFMPPTLVTRSVAEARRFQQEHGAVVVKPIHGNGGKAIFRVPADGENLSALFEVFNGTWPEPHMVQPFLPEVSEGDKRIVLVDGEVAGAINRRPGKGEFRSNLVQGGSAEATTLTASETEICAALGPRLKQLGLIFVGIDVIGGRWLTEINVTSPTGIVAIDKFNGTDTAGRIWDAIERRLQDA